MSSSTALQPEQQRGSTAKAPASGERERRPSKRTRSAEPAPDGGATETGPTSSRPRGDAGAAQHADPWEMTAGLSAALGLEDDGDRDEEEGEAKGSEGARPQPGTAAPVRRKALDAPAWASTAPVRRSAQGGPDSTAPAAGGSEADVARAGFAGTPESSFPHRETIERSFGAPVPATAYADERAGSSSAALGAEGYALGTQVAFASPTPSLAVAAHEAAHVMQATSGVQLYGGEGAYEAHADAVADRVVRGESSTDLLAAGPTAAPAVRRGNGDGKPKTAPSPAEALIKELQALIDHAVWKEIRKTAYPKESAAGIKRAKERKTGARADLTGLGKITALEHFAAAVKTVQKDWATLLPAKRVQAIATAINDELALADVPKFLTVKAIQTEFKGSFSSAQWQFNVSQDTINKSPLVDADAAELCNTALHEARHAEQTFLAARFAAGPPKNQDASTIAAAQGIPEAIAKLAVAKKFDPKTDPTVAKLGQEMYKANVTEGGTNQHISDDDYLTEMQGKRDEARDALAKLKASPTPQTIATATTKRDELKAAVAEVERRYTLYRNIPYESDAHEVGDAAEQAFMGWP